MSQAVSDLKQSEYVLYWMQQSQRIKYNKALNFAVTKANELRLPLLVCFIVTDFPEAHTGHYRFMLAGIKEVINGLKQKKIGFILKQGDMIAEVAHLAKDAALLVMDQGYLRIQRHWRSMVINAIKCPWRIIDSDTVVPVNVASDKPEIAARTLRPRIKRNLEDYLKPVPETDAAIQSLDHPLVFNNNSSRVALLSEDFRSDHFIPGAKAAQNSLKDFIKTRLPEYHISSNDPSLDIRSGMSPYLHFGQISALDIALQIKSSNAPHEAKDAYLEQLIIRRELAVNFTWFTPDYDKYETAVPLWAQKTLQQHLDDKRLHIYSLKQLEQAESHDIYWNAAQIELLITGFMHNYMRMYWGKKIIEWTESPQQAFEWMIYLNNKYQLDGRDPNSFTGIAWCFGLHDHPWQERPVFGKIRYMNAKGLERKFKIKNYASKWT